MASEGILLIQLNLRKQYVSSNGFDSIHVSVNCGVPQGSTLGPLLYLRKRYASIDEFDSIQLSVEGIKTESFRFF